MATKKEVSDMKNQKVSSMNLYQRRSDFIHHWFYFRYLSIDLFLVFFDACIC